MKLWNKKRLETNFFHPPAISLIWFMPSNRTSADHVLYLWNIMLRECYDILPVITLSKPKAQSKTECKRWKILIISPPYAWWWWTQSEWERVRKRMIWDLRMNKALGKYTCLLAFLRSFVRSFVRLFNIILFVCKLHSSHDLNSCAA